MAISIHKKSNPVGVLTSLISSLKINVSSFTIKNDLEEHPGYPSLLSLSDCLTSWNIPHEACSIRKEDYKADELPFPFIAHLNSQGGEFILVHNIEEGKVVYSNERQDYKTFTEEEFLKKQDGVILYAEKHSESGEADFRQALVKGWFNEGRLPFFILMVFATIFYTVDFCIFNIAYASILITKLK